jgi:hypothetical protein
MKYEKVELCVTKHGLIRTFRLILVVSISLSVLELPRMRKKPKESDATRTESEPGNFQSIYRSSRKSLLEARLECNISSVCSKRITLGKTKSTQTNSK